MYYHKYTKPNWHRKRYQDKLRELEKRAPQWLITSETHPIIKDKLMRERHWYDGMVLESTGRTRLHQDLKKTAQLYTQALKHDDSRERIVLLDSELYKDHWCSCSYCIDTFGEPIIVDTTYYTSDEAIQFLERAEMIDANLKQTYDKWEYRY